MKIFGREFRLPWRQQKLLQPPADRGLWTTIMDWWPGRWQQNVEVDTESVLASPAVFACITLIANDMGKMRQKLVKLDKDEIWTETTSPAFSPVLRKPNRYQNHIQFKEWWAYSKLTRGNTVALKQRDNRGIVVALYLLDWARVKPLVSESGDVYYELQADNLCGLKDRVTVPASEVIHDRINCLFHPLIGLSPIFACGMAATKGLRIEENAAKFFANMSRPSGILTAPGHISDDTAARLKATWDEKFTGENAGKVAVLGDALKYESMTMTAVDSEMIDHLKWSAEVVCSVFHVPPFKVGVGTMPNYQNAAVLNQIYYSDCLQSHVEQYELCMDEGLGLGEPKEGVTLGVELDLDALLRMDQATLTATLGEGVKGGIVAPNEARQRMNLKPLTGGETVYLQQQQYSLAALAKRDASDDPFGTKKPEPAPPAAGADPEEDDESVEDGLKRVLPGLMKGLFPELVIEITRALPKPESPPAPRAPEVDDGFMKEFEETLTAGLETA